MVSLPLVFLSLPILHTVVRKVILKKTLSHISTLIKKPLSDSPLRLLESPPSHVLARPSMTQPRPMTEYLPRAAPFSPSAPIITNDLQIPQHSNFLSPVGDAGQDPLPPNHAWATLSCPLSCRFLQEPFLTLKL